MKNVDLSKIISSQARFRILQCLAMTTNGLTLRQLERDTQMQIGSIQLATKALLKEKALKKTADGFFMLSETFPLKNRLQKLFIFLRNESLAEEALAITQKAQRTLQFSDEMRDWIETRRSLKTNR